MLLLFVCFVRKQFVNNALRRNNRMLACLFVFSLVYLPAVLSLFDRPIDRWLPSAVIGDGGWLYESLFSYHDWQTKMLISAGPQVGFTLSLFFPCWVAKAACRPNRLPLSIYRHLFILLVILFLFSSRKRWEKARQICFPSDIKECFSYDWFCYF